jgi:hypothetical protein
MGKRRGAYKVLIGQPEERRPFGRSRHGWEDSVKMDLQNVEQRHGLDRSGSG